MLELLISGIVLLISIFLFKFSLGTYNIGRLNMISFLFYKDFILLTFIGVVLVINNVDLDYDTHFFAITGSAFEESRFYGWLSIMYAMIVFPLGMMLSNLIFFKKLNTKHFISEYYLKKTKMYLSITDNSVFIVLCIFLLVSTFSIIYVFVSIGSMPILSLFSSLDYESLSQARFHAKIGFSGIAAIKDVLAINLTILISYILFAYSKTTGLMKYRILFYYSLFLSIIIVTYNLEKIPLFFYLTGFLLLNIIIKSSMEVKKVILFVIFVFLSLIIVFSLFSDIELGLILFNILSRIFVAETSAIFLGFEYFPQYQEFIGIKGISNFLASIAGEKHVMYGREIFKIYNPDSVERNVAGAIVGFFTAESWILFGLVGVLLSPLYIGFYVQSINNMFMKMPKSPPFIGLYVFITIKLSLTGGISHLIYPIILASIIILFILILFFSKTLQGVKK